MNKRSCVYCRFCTYEDDCRDYVCHNEEAAEYYGTVLQMPHAKAWACDMFTAHDYKMPLKDALRLNAQSDDFIGAFYRYKTPDNSNDYAYVTLAFKSNAGLAEWADAHACLFGYYMDLAKKEGDFE